MSGVAPAALVSRDPRLEKKFRTEVGELLNQPTELEGFTGSFGRQLDRPPRETFSYKLHVFWTETSTRCVGT